MNRPTLLCNGSGSEIRCRPAQSRWDYCEAFHLVYQRYLSAGLVRPNPLGVRIAPQQLQPECRVIVAESRGCIVGTVSLISDERSKLPAEQIFPKTIEVLRASGARLAEVGCLAVLDQSRRFPSPVYLELIRTAICYARQGKYDRLVATVHPRHAKFYERAMGFVRLTGEASYALVNGQPAVCLAGSPHDAQAYREPWRRHFFRAWSPDQLPHSWQMSEIDCFYFSRLREIIDRDQHALTRRAA